MPEQQQEEKMNRNTKAIVGIGVLTAIVIVLQAMAISIRFGIFSITLVLTPLVVGAALYGWKAGAFLGTVFGIVVLLTDAGVFLAINIPGTIITCIAKGALAGIAAGLVYIALAKKNQYLAVLAAGIVAPIVNTGVFLIGCRLFFFDTIKTWAGDQNVYAYMLVGFVGLNFVVEMIVNMVLSTATLRIVKYAGKSA